MRLAVCALLLAKSAMAELPRLGPVETAAGVVEVRRDAELLADRLWVGDIELFAEGAVRYVWLVAQRGDLLLAGVSNGGIGCPALFTWVHAEPGNVRVVEPYFGSCYDQVEVRETEAGLEVVMPAALAEEGWVAYTYDGTSVTRSLVGQRAGPVAPEEHPFGWEGRYVYEMARASDWRGALEDILGAERYRAFGRLTTQSSPFERDGEWIVGHGCNAGFCAGEEAVIALHVSDRRILIALRERDKEPVVFGEAAVYPQAIRNILDR